jgi:hypothetical protein
MLVESQLAEVLANRATLSSNISQQVPPSLADPLHQLRSRTISDSSER